MNDMKFTTAGEYMQQSILTQEHHDYLIALRDSGVVNMWGATPYIEDRFDVTQQEAKAILIEWIQSFKEKE
jgi:uncharacterized protein YciI